MRRGDFSVWLKRGLGYETHDLEARDFLLKSKVSPEADSDICRLCHPDRLSQRAKLPSWSGCSLLEKEPTSGPCENHSVRYRHCAYIDRCTRFHEHSLFYCEALGSLFLQQDEQFRATSKQVLRVGVRV